MALDVKGTNLNKTTELRGDCSNFGNVYTLELYSILCFYTWEYYVKVLLWYIKNLPSHEATKLDYRLY